MLTTLGISAFAFEETANEVFSGNELPEDYADDFFKS